MIPLRRLLAAVVIGLLGAGPASAGFLDAYKPPVDISKEGHRVDSLFYVTTIMLLVLFAILSYVLVVSSIRHRGKSSHHVHFHRGHATRDLTIAAVISASIFFVVDGNLLYNSYEDINDAFWNYPTEGDLTRVQIMPQQWAWRFRLPGNDGQFNTADDIVTLNDLRIPVDKQVIAQMQSADVIHSFFLPNVRQKIDANPGSVTKMTFTPLQTGDFEVVCAEMCGLNHYKMRAEMKVLSTADYARWHEEASFWALSGFDEEDAEAHWGWDWEANE